MTSAISVTDAAKIYGSGDATVTALDGISAEFEQGKFTAIMGPSGSGKSTLLHCLAGLDSLDQGQVRLGDIELGSLSDRDLTLVRREKIGFIFQAFNLIPTLTAQENIVLPLSIAGESADPEWFDTVVSAVGLGDRLTHRPSELSGGQLVSRPEIVFADEPSGNLDSTAGAELLQFMRKAVDEFGQTIVMVTHDAYAASFADRVIFLDDGVIVAELLDPTSDEILDKMKALGD
jgi:putative ABC transport system ATP-binding protein